MQSTSTHRREVHPSAHNVSSQQDAGCPSLKSFDRLQTFLLGHVAVQRGYSNTCLAEK